MARKTIRKRKRRDPWANPIGIEREYEMALAKVGRTIGDLITMGMPETDGTITADSVGGLRPTKDAPDSWEAWSLRINSSLTAYQEALTPWAERISSRMIGRIDNDARRAFEMNAKGISKGIRGTLAQSAAGAKTLELQQAQVALIKSLPMKAAERAQKLSREIATGGRRFSEIEADIKASGKITEGRARLIARTETAKANATLTQARAQAVGSAGYYWRSAEDGVVRESHQEMAERSDKGEIFSWDTPPTLSDGEQHHPGEFPNCRCYAEPVLPPINEV